jgi:hypothetical protein
MRLAAPKLGKSFLEIRSCILRGSRSIQPTNWNGVWKMDAN